MYQCCHPSRPPTALAFIISLTDICIVEDIIMRIYFEWKGISLFVQISGALVYSLLDVEFKTSVFKLINWHNSWGNKAIFLFLILTFHKPVEHNAWKWNMCGFLNPSVPDSPIKVKCEGWLLQMICWSKIKQLKILNSFIIEGSHMLFAANKAWFK